MRLQIRLTLTGMTLIAALMPACNSYKAKQQNDAATATITALDFQSVQKRIFEPHCIRCHSDAGGNKHGVNLETYENIISQLADVRATVIEEKSMPPKEAGGPLSAADQEYLRQWIDAGAPHEEKPQQPAEPPPTEPTPTPIDSPVVLPTWTDISEKIFVPKCIKCHSAGGKADDLPLDDYRSVLDVNKTLVLPGKPEESDIYTEIVKRKMPPKKTGMVLSDSEIEAVRIWILNGAKE